MKNASRLTLSLIATLSVFGVNAAYQAESFYVGASINAVKYDTDKLEKSFQQINDFASTYGASFSAETDNTDAGYKLTAGYQINDYLAVELGYLDAGQLAVDTSFQHSVTYLGATYSESTISNMSLDVTGISASIVGNYAFTERVHGFAKLGLLSWDADDVLQATSQYNFDGSESAENYSDSSTVNGNDVTLSFGLSYGFSEFTLYGEYEVLSLSNDEKEELEEDDILDDESDGNNLNLSSINLGLRYTF